MDGLALRYSILRASTERVVLGAPASCRTPGSWPVSVWPGALCGRRAGRGGGSLGCAGLVSAARSV